MEREVKEKKKKKKSEEEEKGICGWWVGNGIVGVGWPYVSEEQHPTTGTGRPVPTHKQITFSTAAGGRSEGEEFLSRENPLTKLEEGSNRKRPKDLDPLRSRRRRHFHQQNPRRDDDDDDEETHHHHHLQQGNKLEELLEEEQQRQGGGGGAGLFHQFPRSSFSEYAHQLSDRMPENTNQHHHLVLYNQQQQQQQQQPPHRPVTTQSRMRSTGGEIVEVQGGHIVRSTGRKDRHSKVCTAKGPRDRRVRLSAHTAIQFYDVQDRLGYDRPSKAVDWLMKNAKAAIDELAELPAWNPTATTNAAASSSGGVVAGPNLNQLDSHVHGESSNKQMNIVDEHGSSSGYGFGGGGGGGTSFLPPSLDSDSIADTIKSFFPMGAGGGAAPSSAAASENSPIGFQNYPPDLLSRSSSSQNQDLRLSLQSFQDPIFHHPNAAAAATHHQHLQNHPNAHGQQTLFPGFDAAAGLVPWNVGESSSGGGGGGGGGNVGGGYVFNVPFQQQAVAMHQMIGHQGQFFTQRGPLQSSNPPFARAWVDPMAAASSAADYPTMQHSVIHPSFQSFGFASGSSGFSGFRIPARIQGEEEHDGLSDKPSSASSGSRH